MVVHLEHVTLDIDSTVATLTGSQVLTNKSIDSDNNTITNIVNADIKAAAAIDATKIADGSVQVQNFNLLIVYHLMLKHK